MKKYTRPVKKIIFIIILLLFILWAVFAYASSDGNETDTKPVDNSSKVEDSEEKPPQDNSNKDNDTEAVTPVTTTPDYTNLEDFDGK